MPAPELVSGDVVVKWTTKFQYSFIFLNKYVMKNIIIEKTPRTFFVHLFIIVKTHLVEFLLHIRYFTKVSLVCSGFYNKYTIIWETHKNKLLSPSSWNQEVQGHGASSYLGRPCFIIAVNFSLCFYTVQWANDISEAPFCGGWCLWDPSSLTWDGTSASLSGSTEP